MFRDYAPLSHTLLKPFRQLAQPQQTMAERVSLEDPALAVMTDLERTSAVLIRPEDSMEEANRRMIQRGVRLLFVVDVERAVVGLITANDILGEKPLQIIATRGGARCDIQVRDVMAEQQRLEVLDFEDVRRARVGHIAATLQVSGRQHSLVVDTGADGRQRVRGLFSMTQIARQLGLPLQAIERANTFVEIEAQLAHS